MKLSRLLTIILSISFICGIGMALTAPTAIASGSDPCDQSCWSNYCGDPCGPGLLNNYVVRCFPQPGLACPNPGRFFGLYHSCCVNIGCTACISID
ncbi:MAG: hypothetical protein WAU88_01340 [Candidatus Zixiibacteriota bacterium]